MTSQREIRHNSTDLIKRGLLADELDTSSKFIIPRKAKYTSVDEIRKTVRNVLEGNTQAAGAVTQIEKAYAIGESRELTVTYKDKISHPEIAAVLLEVFDATYKKIESFSLQSNFEKLKTDAMSFNQSILQKDDKTPFESFLFEWWPENNSESDQSLKERLILEFLLLEVVRINEFLEYCSEAWNVPHYLSDDFFVVSSSAVVSFYPELKDARIDGMKARKKYSKIQYTHAFQSYLKRKYYEQIDEYKKELKKYNKFREEQSEKIIRLLSPGDSIVFFLRGKSVDAKITKVNDLTVDLEYLSKSSGRTKSPSSAVKSKNIHACFVYEWNKDKYGKVEGYESVLDKEKPVDPRIAFGW